MTTKFYKPLRPIQTQESIGTITDGPNQEAAVCPFCHTVNRGTWHEIRDGYLFLDPSGDTCKHFVGFLSLGGRSVNAHFIGWSDEVKPA